MFIFLHGVFYVILGIKEATEVYKLWKAAKENKEQIENEKNDKKPAPFKFVKVSFYQLQSINPQITCIL